MKEKNILFLVSCIVGNIIVIVGGIRLNMDFLFFIFPVCFVIGISFLVSRIIVSNKNNSSEVYSD